MLLSDGFLLAFMVTEFGLRMWRKFINSLQVKVLSWLNQLFTIAVGFEFLFFYEFSQRLSSFPQIIDFLIFLEDLNLQVLYDLSLPHFLCSYDSDFVLVIFHFLLEGFMQI